MKGKKEHCRAMTRMGDRCRNPASLDGYCVKHYCMIHGVSPWELRRKGLMKKRESYKRSNKPRCKATTKSGEQCSRESSIAGYCVPHFQALAASGSKNKSEETIKPVRT